MTRRKPDNPSAVDAYIANQPPEVQQILHEIRRVVRQAAPAAREQISYRMPTFVQGQVLVHVGAFKDHIGLFPPVREPSLQDRIVPYRGEKGNLRFPLDRPIPLDLIAEIVTARVKAAEAGPGARPEGRARDEPRG